LAAAELGDGAVLTTGALLAIGLGAAPPPHAASSTERKPNVALRTGLD
jgi:hypothetical protein